MVLLGPCLAGVGLAGEVADPAAGDGAVAPLEAAHAHNDYYHARPLVDALERGFCSVEADVFLVNGQLLVGHSVVELRPERSLERLYLAPLRARVRRNDGRVYPRGPEFTLLIDVKSGAESTYLAIEKLLADYADLLTTVEDGKVSRRAVSAIISGGRAKHTIAASSPRRAGIDGRLSDLGTDAPGHLMPLISDRWGSHFSWRGQGLMPSDQRERLRKIVRGAHAEGRRVRFWSTPEREEVWEELLAAGVDLIGVDDLDGLERFLRSSK